MLGKSGGKRKSQSATDYLILTGVIIVVVIPFLYYFQGAVHLNPTNIHNVLTIQDTVKSLGQFGVGNADTIVLNVKERSNATFIDCHNVSSGICGGEACYAIKFEYTDGTKEIIELDYPSCGSLAFFNIKGIHHLTMYNDGNNIVFVSCGDGVVSGYEQCEPCTSDEDCISNNCYIEDGICIPPEQIKDYCYLLGFTQGDVSCGFPGSSYECLCLCDGDYCGPGGYCGDGAVQGWLGEECEPPDVGNCDVNCKKKEGPPTEDPCNDGNSMIAYWKLDEDEGSIAYDFKGVLDGTYNDSVYHDSSHPPGLECNSALFDGSSGYIEILDDADLNFGEGDSFTIEAWINIANINHNYQTIFSKGFGTSYPIYGLIIEKIGGKIDIFGIISDGTNTADVIYDFDGVFEEDVWHYVALVKNAPAGTLTLYWNDDSVVESIPIPIDTTNDKSLFIGAYKIFTIYNVIEGNVDEVVMFNVAFTPEQIALHRDKASQNLGFCNESCYYGPGSGYCGDGIPGNSFGEECDDGSNGDDTDQCYDNCTFTFCGDNIIQMPNGYGGMEGCDDGNNISGDGCSFDCMLEGPSGVCGDGIPGNSPGEECDDGDLDPIDTYYTINPNDDDGVCVIDFFMDYVCMNNICGDGYLCGEAVECGDGIEECDDGNNINGDGCSFDCNLEGGGFCGDGNKDPGEECDGGDFGGLTCHDIDPTWWLGSLYCNLTCDIEPYCYTPDCWDTIDNDDDDLIDYGLDPKINDPGCEEWKDLSEENGYLHCGDYIITPPEECDGGPVGGASNPNSGQPNGGCGLGMVCTSSCICNYDTGEGYCGDGDVGGEEDCELNSDCNVPPFLECVNCQCIELHNPINPPTPIPPKDCKPGVIPGHTCDDPGDCNGWYEYFYVWDPEIKDYVLYDIIEHRGLCYDYPKCFCAVFTDIFHYMGGPGGGM